MLGKLWIDQPDELSARLPKVDAPLRRHVEQFADAGYTVFEKLIPDDVIDQIIAETRRIPQSPDAFVMVEHGGHVDPSRVTEAPTRGQRVLDLFAISDAARQAIAHPKIVAFLKSIFDDDVIAMQSLYFEYGSEQAVHQDTAYVVSNRPLNLAAAWIALEDVTAGAGELIYYPGSHRFDHFMFSGQHKHWHASRDGHEQHQAFLQSLHDKAKASGLEQDAFLAKKGDVLIWHADLAHGGGAITNGQTRKSLVAHYCPKSVKPSYRGVAHPYYVEVPHGDGLTFTSNYYDMRGVGGGKPPVVVFDGGLERSPPLKTIYRSLGSRLRAMVPEAAKGPLRKMFGR